MNEIIILGAGPAGVAVAIGLRRLGYAVGVVSAWRRFAAVEGISERVLESLRQTGLTRAAACAAAPSQRLARWNGEQQAQNIEYLIDRPSFDRALREDLRAADVPLIEGRVVTVESSAAGHRLVLEDGATLNAAFLVEARGRQAPLARQGAADKALRGPETLGLLTRWRGQPGLMRSAAESLPDGWAWMARMGDGSCYWQLTVDVASSALPEKDGLLDYCRQRRAQSALAQDFFAGAAESDWQLHARASTAILCQEVCGDNWLRVGDAAMAVDPLSGNGVFQSLSSALQAPAVINTLLRAPERAALAKRFHQRRVATLFYRFARIGRDFYAAEQQWPDQPFWQARRHWPDQLPSHAPPDFAALRIERAPVLRDHLIAEAEVVITPDQPLGVWHIDGLELAPWLRRLRQEPATRVLADLPDGQRQSFQNWLLAQGFQRTEDG
ncbi:MAG: tryptophan 7-halogenase [Azonexus sp.]|jgi:flavin-dependent dehydrogenase|nr:tryptophan 7-halogenase [Azonexus sp.]